MITLKEAKIRQANLQKTADALLNKYDVTKTLSKYGEVVFDGSYKYGLMVMPDIDIAIYNSNMTPEKVYELGKELFLKFHRVYLSNRTQLPFKEGRPLGVYVGFIVEENDLHWTFDIWVMKSGEDYEYAATPGLEDRNWFEHTDQEQRDAMLLIKYQLHEEGLYGDSIYSFHVYKGVLEGARTVKELKDWMDKTYNRKNKQ